ncbi:hypothetical protein ACQP1W_24610 [Spirillospora sp. CA-255316]
MEVQPTANASRLGAPVDVGEDTVQRGGWPAFFPVAIFSLVATCGTGTPLARSAWAKVSMSLSITRGRPRSFPDIGREELIKFFSPIPSYGSFPGVRLVRSAQYRARHH